MLLSERPVAVVYRDVLLNPNEPFIRSQTCAFARYQSRYMCVRRVDGLDLPSDHTWSLHSGHVVGRAEEYLFKETGLSVRVAHRLRAMKATILHAYTGVDGAVMLRMAARLRIPFVVSFTGFDATASDEQLRRSSRRCHTFLRYRNVLKRDATITIAVSEFLKRKLIERGYDERNVVVHHIGVDLQQFRPDHGIAREPIVLFVGRLLEVKGLSYLIAAMQHVQERVLGAEIVILGDGDLRRQLQDEASRLRVRARFVEFVSPEEVRAWMNRSRVLCVPSVVASNGTIEALPMVALEAQAMGLPVVGFASGGIPESVIPGRTALLVAERDVRGLAEAIETVMTDDSLWTTLSRQGRTHVEQQFDLRRQTERLEDLYDTARDRYRTPAPANGRRRV